MPVENSIAEFAAITGPKRIVSLGGYDFSTDPATASYFSNAVLPQNQDAFANSVIAVSTFPKSVGYIDILTFLTVHCKV
jgi:hypothetical protein